MKRDALSKRLTVYTLRDTWRCLLPRPLPPLAPAACVVAQVADVCRLGTALATAHPAVLRRVAVSVEPRGWGDDAILDELTDIGINAMAPPLCGTAVIRHTAVSDTDQQSTARR